MSIYVEIFIRGNMDELWQKTQDPQLHQRWDLRFSQIDYLPLEPGAPQKFLYSTRIGAGMRIEGEGESTGERNDVSGWRTSALKFWSNDSKSLIESGAGYWKYAPRDGGIRFFTSYDYRARFGVFGRIIDKITFRPLIGWATAWSFDRLRLWIEQGISPEISRSRALVYSLARLALAFIWLYQGLVPKLLFHDPDELRMLRNAGVPGEYLLRAVSLSGWSEVCFALLLVVCWRTRWPLWLTIAAMIAATLAVVIRSPAYLSTAFNPVSLNIAVASLAACGLFVAENLPSAMNCRRTPPEVER